MIVKLKSKVYWAKALLLSALVALSPAVEAQNWAQLSAQLRLTKIRHPEIARQEEIYRKQIPAINAMFRESAPLMALMADELKKRNLPPDLVFLPFVESGYNPYARSPVGASGLWQLMPATAQQYGLYHQGWFDPRRDVLSSTRAAMQHLGYLHRRFNDWLLVLAAYNAGEQRVLDAQGGGRAGATNFWALNLPQETRDYVPKLIALVKMVKRGELALPLVKSEEMLVTLPVRGRIDVRKLAQQLNASTREMLFYNAGFEKQVTPVDKQFTLLLPQNDLEMARQLLAKGGLTLPRDAKVDESEENPLIAERREWSSEELAQLGWGLRITHNNKMAGNTKGLAPTKIDPIWHSSIAPVTKWNPPAAGAENTTAVSETITQ